MSLKSFNKCIAEIRSKKEQGVNFELDDAFELIDRYNLSSKEIDALFELLKGNEKAISDILNSESELEKLFSKYNVKLNGKRRNYVEDLSVRDYVLENTTPVSFSINEVKIETNKWGELLYEVVQYLQYHLPKSNKELYEFRVLWSKSFIFKNEKMTNSKLISDDLYLNCNHTALHSCWLLQDLLELYNISVQEVELIIHRTPYAEPQDLKDELLKDVKNSFKEYVQKNYGKSKENAEKIVSNIEKALNPRLAAKSASYPDFFLFDDLLTLYNYSKDIEKGILASRRATEKNKMLMIRYLNYLYEFYRDMGY